VTERIGLSYSAKQLYKKAKGNKPLRGKKHEPVISTCLYTPCKQKGTLYSLWN